MNHQTKITLAHGSGGRATRELIGRLFQTYFANPVLDRLEDAAVLPPMSGEIAMTTDSYVITPLVFPGGDIGKLAVCGTVNDLWMLAAEPCYLSAGFILEEGLEIGLLEQIVVSMAAEARKQKVIIVAGDTKVINGQGGLYINTTGIGRRPIGREKRLELGRERLAVGDSILVSGTLGNHHACILAQRLGIESPIQSDCASLGHMVRALIQDGIDIKIMRDITRGGLATVLNEIATDLCGIRLEETAIPIDAEVQAFSSLLGLDPLYMANEGKFVCVVAQAHTERALEILHACELGQQAAAIGQIVGRSREDRAVTVRTRLGGTRVVDLLYGEGLPRIC